MSEERNDNFLEESDSTQSGSLDNSSSKSNRDNELSSSPYGSTKPDETKPSIFQDEPIKQSSTLESNIDHRFDALNYKLREFTRELVDKQDIPNKIEKIVKGEVEKKSTPSWLKWGLSIGIPILFIIISGYTVYYFNNLNDNVKSVNDKVEQLDEEIQLMREDLIKLRFEIKEVEINQNNTEDSPSNSDN